MNRKWNNNCNDDISCKVGALLEAIDVGSNHHYITYVFHFFICFNEDHKKEAWDWICIMQQYIFKHGSFIKLNSFDSLLWHSSIDFLKVFLVIIPGHFRKKKFKSFDTIRLSIISKSTWINISVAMYFQMNTLYQLKFWNATWLTVLFLK